MRALTHRSPKKPPAVAQAGSNSDGTGDASPRQHHREVKVKGPAAAPAGTPAPATASRFTFGALDDEIASIALPMLATLAADPIAGLMSTAYVGRLGPADLGGMAVALSVYNTLAKLFNVPLLSATTTIVARATGLAARDKQQQQGEEEKGVDGAAVGLDTGPISAAASAAVALASTVGLMQAATLLLGSSGASALWGLHPGTPTFDAAVQFLSIRALGAPVHVLLLTLQGVFRGLQDTRTPFLATLAACAFDLLLSPALIFGAGWGVRGAAAAIVISQLLPCGFLLYRLTRRARLSLGGAGGVGQILAMFGPSGYLILRTLSNTLTYAMATSIAARAGAQHAAAHQVCFQLWMATTLLADSVAIAAQALLARSLAARDLPAARAVVARCVQLALLLGGGMGVAMGLARHGVARLFTSDEVVLALISGIMPVVVATQPINSLAFVWDGVLFGAGGFKYASLAMAAAAAPAWLIMWLGSGSPDPNTRLLCVWAGLGLLMTLRWVSISVPYALTKGPFKVMRAREQEPEAVAAVEAAAAVQPAEAAAEHAATAATDTLE